MDGGGGASVGIGLILQLHAHFRLAHLLKNSVLIFVGSPGLFLSFVHSSWSLLQPQMAGREKAKRERAVQKNRIDGGK